jgi:hypothetical protein
MTEQPISTRLSFPAWLRALVSRAPTQPPVSRRQSRKLPRIADVLASIGRESGPER